VPEYKWKENGTAIVNVIPIAKEDRIVSVIPVKDFDEPGKSLVFVTRKGQVKRTELREYATNRSIGIAACKLAEQDEVIHVQLSDNTREILLVTKLGMSIRFREVEVGAMGRNAGGVRGIQLREDDEVVAAEWVEGEEGEIFVISDLGYAKSSLLIDYPIQGRGGKGVFTFEFKEGKRIRSNGSRLVTAFAVKEAFDVNIVLASGKRHILNTEKASIEDRKSPGKLLVPASKGDPVVDVVKSV